MRRSGNIPASLTGLYRGAGAAAVVLGLFGSPAGAAQGLVPRIDSFGPYKLGMTLDQAKAAHKGGKPGACGDIAAGRQCIVLDAAVFEEPGVIYAVLDERGGKVERIVVQLDPQLTQRRAYRCVRLAEKVFSLLAVVYGSKFKQSYDQNRRPLPAVAWDGELYGRLIFETKCRTADEGNPRISVVAFQPEGVETPKVAEKAEPLPPPAIAVGPAAGAASNPGPLAIEAPATDPQAVAGLPASISLAAPDGTGRGPIAPEAPVPARAPIGVVEEIKPDISGAVAPDSAMAALARELAQAKGKTPEAPAAQAPAPGADSERRAVPPAPVPAAPVSAEAPAAFPAPVAPASLPVPAPADPASAPPAVRLAAPDPTPAPSGLASALATVRVAAPAAAPVAAPVAPAPAAASSPAAIPPASAPAPNRSIETAVAARIAAPASAQPQQTAALPRVQPIRPGDADEMAELPDLVAPEPFMVPEEEELFRQRHAAPPQAAVQPAGPSPAASAPFALLSSTSTATPPPAPQPAPTPKLTPQPASQPVPAGETAPEAVQEAAASPPADAEPAPRPGLRSLAPVLTGGWRHRAPVPPARPWRERADAADAGAS